MMKIKTDTYFTEDEFKCKCGCGMDVSEEVKEKVALARHYAKTPFVINSGARCLDHNEEVGGSRGSSHIEGVAVDIKANTSRIIDHPVALNETKV